jgi:MMPL family
MDMENKESEKLLQQALLNPSCCDPLDALSENEVHLAQQSSTNAGDETSRISNFFRNPLRRSTRHSSPDALSEGNFLSTDRQIIRHREQRPHQGLDTPFTRNDIRNISVEDVHDCDETFSNGVNLHDWWIILGLIVFWSVGIYSFVQLLDSSAESTNFVGMLHQQSSRSGSPSAVTRSAFARAYPRDSDSNNSLFVPIDVSSPLTIVLNGTAVNRMSPPSTSNDQESSLCSSHSKFTRRGTPMYDLGRNFSLGLEPYVQFYVYQHLESILFSTIHQTATLANTSSPFIRVLSYYSYINDGLEWLANAAMATEDGLSVIIQIFSFHQDDDLDNTLVRAVDAYTNQFLTENMNTSKSGCFSVETTGSPYFGRDLSSSMRHSVLIIIVLVIPLSVLLSSFILSYQCYANLRIVWIAPMVTILTTMCLGSMIAHFFSFLSILRLSIVGIFVMMIVSVGISTTCYMHLLFRYSDLFKSRGISNSRLRGELLHLVLKGSGSVFISISLIFLVRSIPAIQDIVIGTLLGVSAAIIANCTVIPVLLAHTSIGKTCADNSSIRNVVRDGLVVSNEVVDNVLLVEPPQDNHDSPILAVYRNEGDQSFSSQMLPSPSQSVWFCIARNLVHPYRGFILLLIALQLTLPVSHQLKHVKFSVRLEDVLPRNCASHGTYAAISERLGWGRVQPHRILFDGHDANVSMTSKTGFAVMHFVIDQLRAAEMVSQGQRDNLSYLSRNSNGSEILQHSSVTPLYFGIPIVHNSVVSHDLFLAAQFCTAGLKKFRCPLELLRLISATNDFVTSTDSYATYVSVLLASDPYSNDSINWLVEARNTINRLNRADLLSGVRVYIDGPAGNVYDASDTLYATSRITICCSILIVTAIVVIVFQSLAMSILCLLLNVLCFTFSMGFLVVVYQKGFLNWTMISSLTVNDGTDGCYWLVPLVAFPVIVGLGLPGDFLIMHRILKYRLCGYERKSSIALGLDATGGIVCYTGIITALVVGAPLVVSCSPFMQQLSFVVTVSVLLNCLVLHTLLVPTVTAFMPFFWWPRSLPEEKFCLDEFSNRNPLCMDNGIDGHHSAGTYWEALVSSSEYEPLSPYR